MTIETNDAAFIGAMVAIAQWRSNHPGKDTHEEPAEITAHRATIMQRLSALREGDIDPWTGRKIGTLIRKSTRYIVYLDDELDIQWWWTNRLNRDEGLAIIQANITRLTYASAFLLSPDNDLRIGIIRQSRLWGWLRELLHGTTGGSESLIELKRRQALETVKGIRSLIAESMAMVLNGVGRAECEKVQAMAEQQILIEKDQMCRGYFFWQFAIAVMACAGIAYIATAWGQRSAGDFVTTAAGVLQAALAGAFGAFVSAMTRTKELALEPQSGRKGLRIEAFSRALIGAGAAVLVYFAFDSGIILKGALSTNAAANEAIKFFLCIAAGASERILPNLISRAESFIDGNLPDKDAKKKK